MLLAFAFGACVGGVIVALNAVMNQPERKQIGKRGKRTKRRLGTRPPLPRR